MTWWQVLGGRWVICNFKEKFSPTPTYDEEGDPEVEEVAGDDREEDGAGDGECLQEEVRDEDAAEHLRVVAVLVAREHEPQLLRVLDVLRELDVFRLIAAKEITQKTMN